MKLLINICGHDGIVSYYNGVGTMVQRYIYSIYNELKREKINFDINLFTPRYNEDSFGYNNTVKLRYENTPNVNIYMIENGSNGKVNYGIRENWKILCRNTAAIINNFNFKKYDKIITLYNDTPFACLSNYLKKTNNHYKVLILHSTIKIHKVDSAVENSYRFYNERLLWEESAIKHINEDEMSYYGYIGEFILNHMINEYGLNPNKCIKIYNGEILSKRISRKFSSKSWELFEEIKNKENILISFGRAEEYKNLQVAFELGRLLKIPSIVIAQLYYKDQPIKYDYIKCAKANNGILYIDPPFDFAKCILNNFKGNIICLIPSKKEIMGLIINEVRTLKKDNILIVSNDIDGLKEQVIDGYDGVLVDLNDIELSKSKIKRYFTKEKMEELKNNSIESLKNKYNIEENIKKFLEELIGE